MKLTQAQLMRPTQYGYRRSVVENWSELIPSDAVVLISQKTQETHKGIVDAVSDDGSSLWLHLENAGGRKLFLQTDGYQTFADPRTDHDFEAQ